MVLGVGIFTKITAIKVIALILMLSELMMMLNLNIVSQ